MFKKISDSINYEEQKETIENAILLNKINKKQEELYNSKNTHKIIIYVLMLTLLIGIVLFFIVRKNNLRKQQKIIIDKKSLEIEKNNIKSELEEVLLISERDYDFINESKNELNKLVKKNRSDDEIKAFYAKVVHYLNISNSEKKTSNLRVDFLNKIEKKDSLTKTEKKIVVLLRLDMSSKEISNYLNITEKSVEQYRYRIRKKLNIDKGVYLSEYLKSI